MKRYLILVLLWILIAVGHFFIVPNAKIPFLIALSDPSVHGLIAFTIFLPFKFRNIIDIKTLLLLTLSAIFIDIDHAIAAKSISPTAMVSLPLRPISHSILFSLIFGFLAVVAHFKVYKNSKSRLFIFYLFSVSIISHVMRDAIESNNTPWAYPFNSFPILDTTFFIVFISLTFIHMIIKEFPPNTIKKAITEAQL